MIEQETPLLTHLPAEFLTWLWFTSESSGGVMQLGPELGAIIVYVDDRISFRALEDDKPRAVLTGENASDTLEARAALAGGRVVKDLRLALKREDREYSVTLKGTLLDLSAAKLPGMVKGNVEEVLYDRMYLYEELHTLVAALLRVFAQARTSDAWREETLPAMRAWVAEALAQAQGN